MANRKEKKIQKNISTSSNSNKIDKLFGDHTISLIIAILFIVVFIGFMNYIFKSDKLEYLVVVGLFSILSLLAFFLLIISCKEEKAKVLKKLIKSIFFFRGIYFAIIIHLF